MCSLVAYDSNSDSSDNESDDENVTEAVIPKQTEEQKAALLPVNGHISDDEDDYCPDSSNNNHLSILLPKPKNEVTVHRLLENLDMLTFSALPTPKNIDKSTEILEEDDEFLHKKDVLTSKEVPPPPPSSRVKIEIPSLKEFRDVDMELAEKAKSKNLKVPNHSKGSGLLSMLPKAKSEQIFAKHTERDSVKKTTAGLPFVPDSVKNARSAINTEYVDGVTSKTKAKSSTHCSKKFATRLVNCSDSEGSDNEDLTSNDIGDFFSLNSEEKLPEISTKEINALVAKKAAKMAEVTTKYLQKEAEKEAAAVERLQIESEEIAAARKRYHEQQLDTEAMQALVGSSAKRRRNQHGEIQVLDINSDQVLPSREEWMRTALASSTVYQPTGVLVDEEPASGTRRKHQITYLAHKAKANEAELQAMWSANRQTRRATQSKYGF